MRLFRRMFGRRRKSVVITEMHIHYPAPETPETISRVLRQIRDEGIGGYL